MKHSIIFGAALFASIATAHADESKYVAYKQPNIAFTHATIVDGTGAAPKHDQTLVIDKGRIVALGDAARVRVPKGATVIDARGKVLLPGFVMMHEHLFYPTGGVHFSPMTWAFPQLYLAGGTTTMRTGGSLMPYADLNVRDDIAAGKRVGPDIDVSGPYLEGRGNFTFPQMHLMQNAADATRTVDYWASEGVTSFKAYTNINRDELKAAIDAAHAHGLKITGHLCSVSYREAAELGIDNIEHGLFEVSDFIKDKQADACDNEKSLKSIAELDPDSPDVQSLIDLLVAKRVALTSTLPVMETFVPAKPAPQPAMDLLIQNLQRIYWTVRAELLALPQPMLSAATFKKLGRLEKRFSDAGGLLMAGTDPTGYGGVVPGYASKRQIQLLMENDGFSFPEAIRISTLNGAKYLGRDHDIGTLAVGKRADIVVIDGDPMADAAAIEKMPLVFKNGIGYDTAAIFDSMKGKVGLN